MIQLALITLALKRIQKERTKQIARSVNKRTQFTKFELTRMSKFPLMSMHQINPLKIPQILGAPPTEMDIAVLEYSTC